MCTGFSEMLLVVSPGGPAVEGGCKSTLLVSGDASIGKAGTSCVPDPGVGDEATIAADRQDSCPCGTSVPGVHGKVHRDEQTHVRSGPIPEDNESREENEEGPCECKRVCVLRVRVYVCAV